MRELVQEHKWGKIFKDSDGNYYQQWFIKPKQAVPFINVSITITKDGAITNRFSFLWDNLEKTLTII